MADRAQGPKLGAGENVHTDGWDRQFVVYGRGDSAPIKGPPPLDSLKLPRTLMVRLHNELFVRGLVTAEDVRRRPAEVVAALQAAYRVDASAIYNLYNKQEDEELEEVEGED